jgi:hypothetical protein
MTQKWWNRAALLGLMSCVISLPAFAGKGKDKYNHHVPEGSAGAILILAAGALGGGVLVWRRKRRAMVA